MAKKTGIAPFLTSPKAMEQIENIVGVKQSKTFISSVISAVQTNPALADCSNSSILSGALLGESLKLSPSPQLGAYYLVPYGKEAQFQLGYKGYKQLAMRSGQYKKLLAKEVKEGELVEYDPFTEEIVLEAIKDPATRLKKKTIGYFAMFELMNGYTKKIYWTKEQMESHAQKYSKGYKAKKGYTFWEKDFDAMAIKTLYRQLLSKDGIMSVDMQTAYNADMGVIREDGSIDYVDEVKTEDIVAEEIKANANTEVFNADAVEVVDAD